MFRFFRSFLLVGSLFLILPTTTTVVMGNEWVDKFEDFFTDDHCLRTTKDTSSLKDLSNWMGKLVDSLEDLEGDVLKLSDITLPGSHHAVAYDLTTDINEKDPDYQTARDGMITIGIPDQYFSSWICSYALAQSLSISEQLQAGIRYLDLHIDYDGSSFRGSHIMFTTESAEELLERIVQFVKKNDKEIVVVDVGQLYADITSTQYEELQTLLLTTLGGGEEEESSLLVPTSTNITDVTMKDLVDDGTRIILIAHDEKLRNNSTLVWNPETTIQTTFPNTDNVDEMVTYNKEKLALFESFNAAQLYKIQWILTPTSGYIRESPLEGSLYLLAEEANAKLQSYQLPSSSTSPLNTVLGNILSVDYLEISSIFDKLGLNDDQYSDGEFVPEEVPEQSTWTAGKKAGLIVGLIVLLCGCCCLYSFCRKKRKAAAS